MVSSWSPGLRFCFILPNHLHTAQEQGFTKLLSIQMPWKTDVYENLSKTRDPYSHPVIFWISPSIDLSPSLTMTAALYCQLLDFGLPSDGINPSRPEESRKEISCSKQATHWLAHSKQQGKDFKIAPSRHRYNEHIMRKVKWSIQTILFSTVATRDTI